MITLLVVVQKMTSALGLLAPLWYYDATCVQQCHEIFLAFGFLLIYLEKNFIPGHEILTLVKIESIRKVTNVKHLTIITLD